MENTNILFLYSKFSPSCKSFTENIKRNNMNFFKYVNIDDKKSRRVLKKVGIQKLPCIVVIYDTGEKEIFQGDKSYIWFNNILKSMTQQTNIVAKSKPQVKRQNIPPPPDQESHVTPIDEEYTPDPSMLKPIKIKEKRNHYEPQSARNRGNDNKVTSLIDLGLEPKSNQPSLRPKSSKNVVELAKQMASGRESADIPMHQRNPNERKQEVLEVEVKSKPQKSITGPHSGLLDVGMLDETEDVNYNNFSDSESD